MSAVNSTTQTPRQAPRPIAVDPTRRASQASSARASGTGSSSESSAQQGNSVQDLDLDVFLELMLTQLQSQDPLNPMDNQEMIASISQIREISANDKLSETLDSVLLGQNVSTAAGLIGTEVEGLTDDGRRVTGAVQQVAINDGQPVLELAIETAASAGKEEGKVEEGAYTYAVVWEAEGQLFGVQVTADTEDFGEDFKGSIRLENLPLPEKDVARKVYRSNGEGPAKLVGSLPSRTTTSFTDALSNGDLRNETLPENVNRLRYADSAKVKLSNVGSVQTLE